MISTLQVISILTILIPICIGIVKIKKAESPIRLFLLFLVAGLSTEIIMFYLIYSARQEYLLIAYNIYSLIEAIFFYYFITAAFKSIILLKIKRGLILVTSIFWGAFVILFPAFLFKEGTSSQIFDTTYEIIAAFLSGFVLLQLIEKEETVLSSPRFWILIGIFFYCFCTFFIMGFLNTLLAQKIWFLNNIINIITYGFYSIGLLKLRAR